MLIAVAGLAGAGKSTALDHLAGAGGSIKYVGAYVRREVERRGHPVTPEWEAHVRRELRQEHGMGALAELAIRELRTDGVMDRVMIDAIYCQEERICYEREYGPRLVVLGITAPHEIRARRLSQRSERPLTSKQLAERDAYELTELGLADVIAQAHHEVENASDLLSFRTRLDAFAELLE